MPTLEVETVPIRIIPGDIDSKREAYLVMFRLVAGHALAEGFHLEDIAKVLGVPVNRLADWISGTVLNHEVEEMTRKCLVFAHGLGLDLEPVER